MSNSVESPYMEDQKTFTMEDQNTCSEADKAFISSAWERGGYLDHEVSEIMAMACGTGQDCSYDILPEEGVATEAVGDGQKTITTEEDSVDKLGSVLRCLRPNTADRDGESYEYLPRMASPTPGNSSKIEEHQTGVQQKQNPEASVSTPALIGPENSAGSLPRNTSPPQGKRYETKAEYEAKREIRILEKYKTTEENYASASLKAKNTALKPDPYDADEAEFSYEMSHKHRGVFVIFNEKNFSIPDMGDRPGTDVDAARLTTQFSRLGFEVRLFNNKTCSTMMHIMEEVAREDHRDADCFACAVMSHGDEGIIYGTDGILQITTLVAAIKRCPTLRGKPKLFFIQACRGNNLDHGVDVADGDDEVDSAAVQRIPLEADFLFAYSTTPGYFSWRAEKSGSWFMQALCNILEMYGQHRELMWMLTRVNRCVARKFESRTTDPYLSGKKQIPSIVSQLTGLVYFHPKPQQPQQLSQPQLTASASMVEIARLSPVYGEQQSRSAPTSSRSSPVPVQYTLPQALAPVVCTTRTSPFRVQSTTCRQPYPQQYTNV